MPRTILITGSTDGLGRALALDLAGPDTHLILHGRNPARLEDVLAVVEAHKGTADVVLGDFASLTDVASVAAQVAELTEHLDVLVNNAGIGFGEPEGDERSVSADGHELRFAVNYLATFGLTMRLLPLLRKSPGARIVMVSSLGQEAIDFDDVMIERDYTGWRAYRQSKLAQVEFAFELAERLGDALLTVTALHPSTYMPTKMVLSNGVEQVDSLEAGVAATRRLAVGPDVDGVTGAFFDRQTEARANRQAYDAAARRRLWDLSLELTSVPDLVPEVMRT